MTDTDKRPQLIELFLQTGTSHHQAYLETDGADPEWPLWYAGFLQAPMSQLLSRTWTQSELVYLLMTAETTRQEEDPEAGWPGYYADYFLAQLNG